MAEIIKSVQNGRVKDAVRLRDRRHREKQGRIVIDGTRELGRALVSGVRFVEVFFCPGLCSEAALAFLDSLPTAVPLWETSGPVFEKLAFGERCEGVLGVAEPPCPTLLDVHLPTNGLVGVLESVEKPGNLGAVLRSADGAGVSALIAANPRTDLFNPNAIRASLGTIFRMPLCAAESGETLDWLVRQGLTVYAARVDGAVWYTEADFRRPSAIVLGNEAEGLSSVWSGPSVVPIRLPMLGMADSLNVSAAAAVLFYEARRQRGWSER